MKEASAILDNKKWLAVASCDSSYDGLFFYGVKTTGIFCRPSCKSKTPGRSNVIYFDNASAAVTAGFRPCKRCRPDEIVFEPGSELSEKVKAILEADYDKQINLSQVSKQLGVSINHLIKLFKQHNGVTPEQYIIMTRVNKASELLEQTEANILEIAYAAGFKSLSNFYRCFKNQTGLTPNEYRKSRGGS